MSQHIPFRFQPYDEQREVMESDARFRVIAAGRRSGKTIMAAAESVRRALEGGRGWHGYWVGAEHKHADTAFNLVDRAVDDGLVSVRNQSPPRKIEFSNGAVLEFHTSGGGALVSIGLDWVVCDEAGKEFPERSWTEELRPALSDKLGEAMFISTPGGRGWFYRMLQRGKSEDNPDIESWSWSTYANPHVDDSEIDAAKEEEPDAVFRQEYLAEFISETGGVFTELGERVFTAEYDLPIPADDTEGPFSIGVDLAQHQDHRVTIVLDSTGRVVYFDRGQGESWPKIQRDVESVAADYPGIVAIDGTRKNKVISDLEASGVPIEPVTFSGQRKRELIQNLITTVEAGELTAPEIPQLRQEMEVFEYDLTRTGNVSYDAPEGFHDDTVDALALAVDGLAEANRQAASTTASIDDGSGGRLGGELGDAVTEWQRRNRGNKWK